VTTIAYRSGILVADSRATTDDIITGSNHKKLYELADGGCLAFTGTIETAMVLIDWMIAAAQVGDIVGRSTQPKLEDDARVIHLRPDSTVWITINDHWVQCYGEYHAWGSGMAPALGCLAAGLDPVAAVVAACKVDVWSGGTPQVFALPEAAGRLKEMMKGIPG